MPNIAQENDFFSKVYDVVRLIPYGKVTSYGAIANYLGAKRSARMVGWAMNASHHLEHKIPAHRVVNRQGLLTGKAFFGTGNEMANLLIEENISFDKDLIKITGLENHFWDPMLALAL